MTRTAGPAWPVLIAMLVLCFAVAGLGGAVTAPAIPTWYAGLAKPSFNPPNGVFAPVWTTLYALMAVAAWLAWRAAPSGRRSLPLALFLLQLGINALWSPLFFGAHLILPALIDIGLLIPAVVATIVAFWRVRPVAGALLLPYLAWISFAFVLNAAIWRLNGSA